MKPVRLESGAAGVAAMQERKRSGTARLVVLDAQMPEMDGFAVADAIRHDPDLAGPPS